MDFFLSVFVDSFVVDSLAVTFGFLMYHLKRINISR